MHGRFLVEHVPRLLRNATAAAGEHASFRETLHEVLIYAGAVLVLLLLFYMFQYTCIGTCFTNIYNNCCRDYCNEVCYKVWNDNVCCHRLGRVGLPGAEEYRCCLMGCGATMGFMASALLLVMLVAVIPLEPVTKNFYLCSGSVRSVNATPPVATAFYLAPLGFVQEGPDGDSEFIRWGRAECNWLPERKSHACERCGNAAVATVVGLVMAAVFQPLQARGEWKRRHRANDSNCAKAVGMWTNLLGLKGLALVHFGFWWGCAVRLPERANHLRLSWETSRTYSCLSLVLLFKLIMLVINCVVVAPQPDELHGPPLGPKGLPSKAAAAPPPKDVETSKLIKRALLDDVEAETSVASPAGATA